MNLKLTQLTDNIWLWPHYRDPGGTGAGTGVIVGQGETVLVDAGNSPRAARQLKEALLQTGLPPVSRIIYTHHHWDHVYGACEFDAPVVAHVSCREILLEEAKKPWGDPVLRQEMMEQELAKNPKLKTSFEARERAVQEWDSFRIIVPELVFETAETLQLGGLTYHLQHVGGQHAQDSLVVEVPAAKTVFLADCFYPPPLHLRRRGSTFSPEMLARYADEPYDLFVEGHDDPFTKADLLEFLEETKAD